MIRVILYDKLTHLIKNLQFIQDNEYSVDKLSELIGRGEKTVNELLRDLSDEGLSIYVTNIKNSYDEVGYEYELNVVPYRKLNKSDVIVLQFVTLDFDEEELNRFLEIPEINDIYLNDDKFKKLISSVLILGGNAWTTIFNYLEDVYGFSHKLFYYKLDDSQDTNS